MLLARAGGLEGFARHVVIKRIRPELASEERFVSAFLEEARIAASLHHQNIVQVHDIGDEGGSFYFAMEYIHGEDCRKLFNRIRERNEVIPLPHVMSIIMATAAGLHYAHEQVMPSGESKGIVHRDVSPANILIGYDGSVKLVDFGLAKAVQRSTNATSSGTLKGKSSYMSPEQCTGKPLDRRTDTFSLGIVLFELLTAQRLFKGINEFMTMAAIVDGDIPRPSTLRADVPPALDEIILRALSRAPESRYQTAEAFRESLEAFSIAAELRTSSKALSDYVVSVFGERPEPWLDTEPDRNQSWADAELTHAGLVAKPRDQKEIMERFAPQAESPMAIARSETDSAEWGNDDEHELTAGQLPSLRRQGQQQLTEPTQTLRPPNGDARTRPADKPAVNPNVRPRASEPPQPAPPPPRPRASEPPQPAPAVPRTRASEPPHANPNVRPRGEGDSSSARNLVPPGSVNPNVRPRASEPAIVVPPKNEDITAVGRDEESLAKDDVTSVGREDKPSGTPQPSGQIPGSSTMVEPPIFDGLLRADDDDGLDEDEPATEISMTTPEIEPPPVKEKVPMALRRPVRQDQSHELQRSQQPPAPLRPAPRIQMPGSQSQSMPIPPNAREVTPTGSRPVPSWLPTPPPGSFGGDPGPGRAPTGYPQSMPRNDPSYATVSPPPPPPDNLNMRLTGFSAGGRTILIVGVGIAIVLGGVLGARGCGTSEHPAAQTTEQDAAVDSATEPEPATPARDAGVRTPSGSDAGGAGAGSGDSGAGSATTTKKPPIRKLPIKRPKTK